MKEEVLQTILSKYMDLDFKNQDELKSENLLGNIIGLEPRTLVEIYVDLKKICKKEELTSAVISGNFKSYDDLLKLLEI